VAVVQDILRPASLLAVTTEAAFLWAQEYDTGEALAGTPPTVAAGTDGFFLAVSGRDAAGVTQARLVKTDRAGSVNACSLPITSASAPWNLLVLGDISAEDWSVAATPVMVSPVPAALGGSLFLCSSGCSAQLDAVRLLKAVKRVGSADFSWTPGSFTAFNLWYVTTKEAIDSARQSGSPPAVGVQGCSPPLPAAGASCLDDGAVGRAPALLFYQVRAACGGEEGP
jgi:hypothetical protein